MSGGWSARLMVRNSAMDEFRQSRAGVYQTYDAFRKKSVPETLSDRGDAFKPAAAAEHGERRPAAPDQRTPGGPGALDRHGVHLGDDFVHRDRGPVGDQLARQLLGARARAFQRDQDTGLHLRLGAGDLLLGESLGRAPGFLGS